MEKGVKSKEEKWEEQLLEFDSRLGALQLFVEAVRSLPPNPTVLVALLLAGPVPLPASRIPGAPKAQLCPSRKRRHPRVPSGELPCGRDGLSGPIEGARKGQG